MRMSSVGLDARAREGGGGTGASDGRTLGRWWRKPKERCRKEGHDGWDPQIELD
jgi:hypothetical protein